MMGHAGMAATAVRYLRSVGAPTTAGTAGTTTTAGTVGAPTAAGAAGAPTVADAAGVEPLPRPDLRSVGEHERAPVDPADFRRVLGTFATGVTVVTAPVAAPGEGPAGFACQSFASLSLDPPLVAFMVARTSTTWPRIARAGVFCVNVLGAEQGPLCRAFAVSGADKFAGVVHRPAPVSGAPLLDGAAAWVDCAINAVHTGGDHLIVVGRVTALGTDPAEGPPLLFHRGRFARLADG